MSAKILIIILCFINFALAQENISTNREAELSLSRASFENYKHEKRNADTVIYAGYHQQWTEILQLGFEAGVLSVPDGSDNKSVAAAMAIVTQNLNDDWTQSPFIQLGAGLYPAYDDNELESEFSYFGGLGYRMDVLKRVTYKPYLRIWQRGSERLRYEVQALNFSFFF